jgi:two-component system, response regulator PdtaR
VRSRDYPVWDWMCSDMSIRIVIAEDESVIRMDLEEELEQPKMDGIEAAATLTREKLAPVLLFTALSDDDMIERARAAGVVHFVTKPWREKDLKPAIEIALSRFSEFRAMENKVKDLEEALATRKVVEKAKGVLMEKYKLSESEAFKRIQRLSMNNRKSMREVAEAILLAEELNVQ